MSKELSAFQSGKVILGLIEDLKNLPNKKMVYMNPYHSDNKLMKKIADRAGIDWTEWREKGIIDITEDVDITLEMRIEDAFQRLNGGTTRSYSNHREIEFAVSDELKLAVEEFEKKNIPPSGTCSTHLGEMFRAMQYIQYRAFNDGDLCWDPGSPTFTSYIYLKSQIDELNYSSQSYNEETGKSEFEFTDEFLVERSWEGKISDVIEDNLATTANFIKYQLMDLLLNGKLEDSNNEFDSRDYSSLKKDRY
jgi:hypothetical protein